MGCCYERQKRYETAKKWFEIAYKFPIEFNEDKMEDIFYG